MDLIRPLGEAQTTVSAVDTLGFSSHEDRGENQSEGLPPPLSANHPPLACNRTRLN